MARDLMPDEEWAFFERFILAVRAPNGPKPTNHRLVLNGIFWIAQTGAPCRDLPEEFGKWDLSSQFLLSVAAGVITAKENSGEVEELRGSIALFGQRVPTQRLWGTEDTLLRLIST